MPGAIDCGFIRRYSGWPTTTVGNYTNNPAANCLFNGFESGAPAHLVLVDYNGVNTLNYRIYDVVDIHEVRYTTKTSSSTNETVQICTGLTRDFFDIYVSGCTPA